jgi:ribosomal protein L40E
MTQEKFTKLLNHTFSGISEEIKWCLEYNQGFTLDSGKFGERVLFIVENTKGVPSNGGCAFDGANGSESKNCFLAQTYVCDHCKAKNNYYSDKCYKCESKIRKDPKDSRWGIDTKAHFKYANQIPCYIFTHVEPLNQDPNNPKYRIRVFRIDSKNKMFNDILEYQLNNGKKPHKNFMPFGRDFYMSSPIPLVDCSVDISDKIVNVSYDLYCPENQDSITKIPIDIFNAKEQKLFDRVFNGKVLVEDVVKLIGVKKSTHGKERGVLDRNKNL